MKRLKLLFIMIICCTTVFCGCNLSDDPYIKKNHVSSSNQTEKNLKEMYVNQECNNAYSELLSSYNDISEIVMLYINSDSIPEIAILENDKSQAELYSYDGEVYKVCDFYMNDYSSGSFHCRSQKNMLSYSSGCFAKGTALVTIITFYEEDDGRLVQGENIKITSKNQDASSMGGVNSDVKNFHDINICEDTIEYGQSWKFIPCDCVYIRVDDLMIGFLPPLFDKEA